MHTVSILHSNYDIKAPLIQTDTYALDLQPKPDPYPNCVAILGTMLQI